MPIRVLRHQTRKGCDIEHCGRAATRVWKAPSQETGGFTFPPFNLCEDCYDKLRGGETLIAR